jgi:hypothetical protein
MSYSKPAIFRRTGSAVALAAVAAVAVSACGSSSSNSSSGSAGSGGSGGSNSNGISSKSANQILSSAVSAAEAAKSLHVAGAVKNGGESIGLDLSIVTGKGASGTISEGSASFKLVQVGGNYYIQPSPAFLLKFTHSQAGVQLFKGKWLRATSSDANFQSFGELTSINGLMGSLTKSHGTLSKGSTSKLDGQPVIAVDSSKGGTVYVATTGKPYPLQLSKSTGGQTGKVTFSQYNKSFSI